VTRRNRKLIGAASMIAFVVVYALVAMNVAQAPALQAANGWVQGFCYAALGLGWIIPIFPLIVWMERKDRA
jgi:L-lactate permease